MTLEALKSQVGDLLATAKPQEHQWLFERLGVSLEARAGFIPRALDQFETRPPDLRFEGERVPRLIHRLWLTNPDNPSLPPEPYLRTIAARMPRLPHYTLVFWSNCEAVAQHVRQILAPPDSGPASWLHMEAIDALAHDPLHARVAHAIAQRKFVLAGDIFKHFLIARFGGIYADLGVDFGDDLIALVERSDLSLFLCDSLFFQPAFMAAPAGSPPFRLFCKLLLEPEILAARCFSDAESLSAGAEIWMHGGVGFTACLMLFDDQSSIVLPVPPNRGLMHVESLGSWYRETGNYGGVRLANAGLSHIDPVKFREARQRAQAFDAGNGHFNLATLARLGVQAELDRRYLI